MGVMCLNDDSVLNDLGYRPRFKRTWSSLTNTAITVSAMSVLLSITASFSTGLNYGGPVVMVWGWFVVSGCCVCIGLGMAELTSAYPTSGGMYFWMYQLLGPKWGPFVCWVNGWLNLLGQIASLASTHFAAASLIQTYILLATGTARPDVPYPPPPAEYTLASPESSETSDYEALPPGRGFVWDSKQTLGLYAGLLVLSATLNSTHPLVMKFLTEMGAYFHVVGVIVCIIAVPCIAPKRQSASWVFTHFEYQRAEDAGITNKVYAGMLGLLLPAFSYTGYDGPAHMAEESVGSRYSNSRGIMTGIYFMVIFGWAWVVSLLFSISDVDYILGDERITPEANGNPVPQIFWDAFQDRFGRGYLSLGILIIPILGVIFCGVSTLTYIARIMFAYSRDRAVPLSSLWIKIAPNNIPVYAVWGATVCAFVIAIPSVWNTLAFTSIVSLSTIALNVAYVAPSFVRITFGRHRFTPGPWSLGKWAYPVNIIATIWVTFAVIVFSLPTTYPVEPSQNLNYAGVVMGGTLALSVIWFYFPFIGAYKWFKGPINEFLPSDGEDFLNEAARGLAGEASTTKDMVLDDDSTAAKNPYVVPT